jgi:hypothetical protein
MSFVSNSGKFKLYTVLNGLIFPTPTHSRISFERAIQITNKLSGNFQISITVMEQLWKPPLFPISIVEFSPLLLQRKVVDKKINGNSEEKRKLPKTQTINLSQNPRFRILSFKLGPHSRRWLFALEQCYFPSDPDNIPTSREFTIVCQ